jgi:hypothetical protein
VLSPLLSLELVVVAVAVALISVELKERETLPGQEVSLSPLVKNVVEVVYLPRLFVGKSVAPSGLQVRDQRTYHWRLQQLVYLVGLC